MLCRFLQISALDERSFVSIADKSAYVWGCADDAWSSAFGGYSKHSMWASSSFHSGAAGSDSASCHTGFEMQRLLAIRNTPDGSIPISGSTTVLHTFEQNSSSSTGMDIGVPSKPLNVLYCVCGHKMYAGRIPSLEMPKVTQPNTLREVCFESI
jgi:hypothetical protein